MTGQKQPENKDTRNEWETEGLFSSQPSKTIRTSIRTAPSASWMGFNSLNIRWVSPPVCRLSQGRIQMDTQIRTPRCPEPTVSALPAPCPPSSRQTRCSFPSGNGGGGGRKGRGLGAGAAPSLPPALPLPLLSLSFPSFFHGSGGPFKR